MTANLTIWDRDLQISPEEEYQDFVRALKRKKGFDLYFVECSQSEGDKLISRVKEDLSDKKVEVIRLVEAVNNLYNRIASLAKEKPIDILLIQGIEYSLYKYELKKFGQITELQYDNFRGVPRILDHLNQRRERFRDDFDIRFVYLLRPFALKYFIFRAPDFFDWRAGTWKFPTAPEVVEEKSSRILLEGTYEEYLKLTPNDRVEQILEIQELLAEKSQTRSTRSDLFFELGNLLAAAQEYEGAINSYDQAIKNKPNFHEAWYNRGNALGNLGYYQEAIASFDRAVEMRSDYQAWFNKACCYALQGNFKKTIENLKRAMSLDPEECREMAKIDSAFDKIRADERFQKLILNKV